MKTNLTLYGLLMIAAILISGCEDKDIDNSDVSLNFQLQYDGTPVYSGMEIDYDLGYTFFLSKYSLFLSDITLISAEGNHVLSNVEFVNLLDGIADSTAASEGTTLNFSNVPTREYTALKFNIGVSDTINATSPNMYETGNPLANTAEYWAGWSSYIFHKIEGRIDNPVNADSFDTALALHIGSNAAYRETTINQTINIASENDEINLGIDLKNALNTDSGLYDLLARPQVHSQAVLPMVLPILDATSMSFQIR